MIFMSVQVVLLLSAVGDGSGVFFLLVLSSFKAYSLSGFSLPSTLLFCVFIIFFTPHNIFIVSTTYILPVIYWCLAFFMKV